MMAAFDSETARKLQTQFQGGRVRKTYLTLCRGWLADQGRIDSPLASDTDPAVMKSAVTYYETLHRFELPEPSAGHGSSRFSLLLVRPETGRWHQIRRHLKRLSHPVIGDTVHGDGVQNRIWRRLTGESRLYLLAWALAFEHPESQAAMRFTARFSGTWHRVFDRAQACPSLLEGDPFAALD
jgi:tRNA pseudouridine65 synthase